MGDILRNKKMETGLLRGMLVAATMLLPLAAQKPAIQGRVVKQSAEVPSLAALAESPQSQVKGGLRITVSPEVYNAKESWIEELNPAPPPSKWGLTLAPSPTAVFVEKRRIPELAIVPDRLVFHVNLNNGMPRVFRGSGIAVQFNIAGKLVTVDPSGYGDLVNIILPPRSTQDVTILGPPISDIKSPCTVSVFFYDAVTGMDNAGNVTEKQNFEWYFSYQTQTVEKEFNVPPPTRTWVEGPVKFGQQASPMADIKGNR